MPIVQLIFSAYLPEHYNILTFQHSNMLFVNKSTCDQYESQHVKNSIKYRQAKFIYLFLAHLSTKIAHLSTKCSVSFCDPSMSGVRRPSSVRACVCACVRASTISLNNIFSETAYWILTKLFRNDPWVVPYQSCSNRSSWLHK